MPKCPQCGAEAFGTSSEGSPACVFFDDTGQLHHHYGTRTHYFVCNSGHEWREEERQPCDVCEYEWLDEL